MTAADGPATDPRRGILLDTCAVIYAAIGTPVAPGTQEALLGAGRGGGIHVSPVSAWEVGLLARGAARRSGGPEFLPDPRTWFERVMDRPGFRAARFTAAIAIAASFLPGDLHGDPADRLLIATARDLGLPLLTRDARILAYGRAGHVAVLAC